MTKVLCVEFSNKLIDENRLTIEIFNRELFYKLKEKDGFVKNEHFCEFPQWINYVVNIFSSENVTVHASTNINETINFINNSEFNYVFFSMVEVTSTYINNIIKKVKNNNIKFIIGTAIGSNKINFNKDNIFVYSSFAEFVKYHNIGNRGIYPKFYINELSNKFIPRIYTTTGCNSRCTFCKNEGHMSFLDKELISRYYSLIPDNGNGNLVYLGNKTFLQGGIDELNKLPNISNRDYIVQTSVNTILSNIHLLQELKSKKVKFIELGIESFSKNTLNRLGKNVNLIALPYLLETLYNSDFKVIGNFMLGIKGDNEDDYAITIEGIEMMKKYFYSLNITNYSEYDSTIHTDRQEVILIKSWIKKMNTIKETLDFANAIYRLNYEIMQNEN